MNRYDILKGKRSSEIPKRKNKNTLTFNVFPAEASMVMNKQRGWWFNGNFYPENTLKDTFGSKELIDITVE